MRCKKKEGSSLTFLQKKKRSLIKRCLLKFVNKSHSYLIQHIPEWMAREKFELGRWLNIWEQDGKSNNIMDPIRLCFLIENTKAVLSQVAGAIAELGVYRGTSAKVLHELAPDRKLFLFDTFSGFDKRDLKGESSRGHHFEDNSLNQVKQFLGDSSNLVFCPGYFPETARFVPADEKFALVHLDADLYEPTLAALEFFYNRMTPGGMIILHDYSSGAWSGVKAACDLFFKDKREKLIHIPDKSGTAVLRKL